MRGRSRAISAKPLAAALFIAAPLAAQQTGHVLGTVRTAAGVVANARAILDSTREVRTDAAGRFQFRDIAAGRHSLAVLSIGMTPYAANVMVPANDSLDFEVTLVKTVVLDSVVVEGSTVRQGFARAFEDRKRVGLGRFLDSTEVRRYALVHQAVASVPGVKYFKSADSLRFTDSFGGLCRPNIWIDMQNWGTDQGVLGTIRTSDIAGVEVYARSVLVPDEFRARGLDRGCGALVFWTKRFWPQGKGKP